MSGPDFQVLLDGPRNAKIDTIESPTLASDKDVLIEVKCVGITDSDISLFDIGEGEQCSLGQEASGVVLQAGKQVQDFSKGDRVCLSLIHPCRGCPDCTAGDDYVCAIEPQKTNHAGFMQSKISIDNDLCRLIPDSITMESAAILGSVTKLLFICRKTNICSDTKVHILGHGYVGYMLLHILKSKGVTDICVSDYVESEVELAKSVGATHGCVIDKDKKESANGDRLKKCCGYTADVTFDTFKTTYTKGLSKLITASSGIIALIGTKDSDEPNYQSKSRTVMDLCNAIGTMKDYLEAAQMMDSMKINAKDIVTHRFTCENLNKGLQMISLGTDNSARKAIFKINHGEC